MNQREVERSALIVRSKAYVPHDIHPTLEKIPAWGVQNRVWEKKNPTTIWVVLGDLQFWFKFLQFCWMIWNEFFKKTSEQYAEEHQKVD